jgi:hypothetical protein
MISKSKQDSISRSVTKLVGEVLESCSQNQDGSEAVEKIIDEVLGLEPNSADANLARLRKVERCFNSSEVHGSALLEFLMEPIDAAINNLFRRTHIIWLIRVSVDPDEKAKLEKESHAFQFIIVFYLLSSSYIFVLCVWFDLPTYPIHPMFV